MMMKNDDNFNHLSLPIASLSHLFIRTNNFGGDNLGSSSMEPRRRHGHHEQDEEQDGAPRRRLLVVPPLVRRVTSSPSVTSNTNLLDEVLLDYVLDMIDDQEPPTRQNKRSLYKRANLSAFQNDVLRDGMKLMFLDHGTGRWCYNDGNMVDCQQHSNEEQDEDDLSVSSSDFEQEYETEMAELYRCAT
jgi:hypothetical protein